MKQVFKQYRAVAAMLAAILLLSVGLTVLTGGLSFGSEQADEKTVLATTYPIYVAAQHILGEDTSVSLHRLDGAASGCLHDYQLSPSDRRLTQEADLILMNGAGAEPFLHGLVDEVKCVDTSAGLELLCAEHHDHSGEEHHHEEAYNEHIWLSPRHYMAQVEAVLKALCILNPEMATQYEANAVTYYRKIDRIALEVETYCRALSGKPCILFHDSMSYLAADLGLDVKLTLSVEGESGLSAADLRQVEALAAEFPDLLLFYDGQYPQRYDGVGGTAVVLNTAVIGEGTADDWLTAMQHNMKEIQKVTGVSP